MATVVPFQAQPEGVEVIQLSYLSWLETQENDRALKYGMFRDYYEGEHLSQLTARMRKFLQIQDDQEFNLNICPIIVDSLAEKLKVQEFSTETDEKQHEVLEGWWAQNRMDGQQGVVHLSGVRDGDTYVLVEWDNERKIPLFTQESAYDTADGMHVVYSDEKRLMPVVAIKRWTITNGPTIKTRRTNLYYPDRIEKYSDMGTGSNWQRFYDEGQDEWPIPWKDKQGKPLGIPVVHFRNKDQGRSYGESELEDVTPVQNAVNKSLIDILSAADTTGFQMITATGVEPGATISVAPGALLRSTNPDAKFGTIAAAAFDSLIGLKDSLVSDAAKITRTPTSFFQLTGSIAAAGTLKEQRAGLIAKAQDRQVAFGNSWEDVMRIARRLHNLWGAGTLDESVMVSCVWKDDEKPSSSELSSEVETASRAGAMSTKTKVKTLHPDWSEEEIAEEVVLINQEEGRLVTDLGPTMTDDEIAARNA